MTILVFILLLIVSFLVLLYFLRPSVTETAVQQHLESIEENRAVEGDGTTILRRQALSATPGWTNSFAICRGPRTWRGSSGRPGKTLL